MKWLSLFFIPFFLFASCPKENQGCLKKIILIDSDMNPDKICPCEDGVIDMVQKVDLTGIEKVLTPYLDNTITSLTPQNIKNTTLDFLSEKGIFAMVVIPEQEVKNGAFFIEILSTKIGTISFEEQKWFSKSVLEGGISLKEGGVLDQSVLLNDLAYLNRNPFRQTEIILNPGEKRGTTNLEFFTNDRFPFHFYVGGDNTGVVVTDKVRLFAGMSWGNAFWIGDMLCYRYTASDDFHRFQSHTLTYTANIASRRDILAIFGGYGMIHPDITDFRSDGKSAQASMRYKILIEPLYRRFKQQLNLGFDYKYVNSNLFFAGTITELPLAVGSINITQLTGAYSLSQFWERHQVSCKIEGFLSPWKGLLPHQTDAAYRVLRQNATVRYAYFKTEIAYRYQLWKEIDCNASIFLRGQAATSTLPSSEQFSLGGLSSVRGYEQAQFLSDNAICSNIEFYFPSIQTRAKIRSKSTFFVFWDVGYGVNYKAATSSVEDQLLSGLGPAFRFEIPSYFSLKTEYGFRLTKIPGGTAGGRFYLSAMLSY